MRVWALAGSPVWGSRMISLIRNLEGKTNEKQQRQKQKQGHRFGEQSGGWQKGWGWRGEKKLRKMKTYKLPVESEMSHTYEMCGEYS